MRLPVAFAVLCVAFAVLPEPAAAAGVAAYVAGIGGDSRDYHVMRAQQSLAVRFNMPLLDGDVIALGGAGARLRLRYVDGRDVTVTPDNAPYRVSGRGSQPAAATNFLEALWDDVTKAHDLGLRSTSMRDGTATSNDPLAVGIPGLGDGTAVIAAGRRHLMLEWSGGVAPYRFLLYGPRGTVLADETGIGTPGLQIGSHAIDFAPGRYRFVLSDATKVTVTGSFEAVSRGVPALGEPRGDRAQTDAAAKLAAGGDPKLAYEAYLRLFDAVASRWEPAQALAAWIARGEPHGRAPGP